MRGLKPPKRRERPNSVFAAQVRIASPPPDLSAYAPLASPALTGTPTAPTPPAGDNSTKLATTAFVAAGGGATWSPVDGHTVAYWPLDEEAGSGAFDHAGQFFLQDDSPTATTRPGVAAGIGPSTARAFNGISDGLCWKPAGATVSEAGPLYLTSLGSWTLDAWVWMDPAGTGGTAVKWAGWGTNTSGSGGRLIVQPTQIQIEWLYGGGSPVAVDAVYTGTITTSAWHCVQVRKTWDPVASTAKVEIYLDNALVSTTTGLHNCQGDYSWRVAIGKDGGYSSGFWRGRLQMVRFSRGARANAELSDFYTKSQLL